MRKTLATIAIATIALTGTGCQLATPPGVEIIDALSITAEDDNNDWTVVCSRRPIGEPCDRTTADPTD